MELPVIFRKIDNEIVALFPTVNEGYYYEVIASYAHIGQHCAASVELLTQGTKATPDEYASLLAELRGIYESGDDPVTLKVYQRASGKAKIKIPENKA